MKAAIQKISRDFIEEALHSPNLLEDMASMEMYMAESYGGRTFVELLQNADDVCSSKIKMISCGNHLLFANNGRAFSEADITAISRSGASSKQRGVTIGYRGVGFKSTTSLSNDIIICSNGCYFTFSKRVCAIALGVSENRVPTIRIPFLLQESEVEEQVRDAINQLQLEGFTTIFVFKNAEIGKMIEEVKEIHSDCFIFLRNIEKAEFHISTYIKSLSLQRSSSKDHRLIHIQSEKDQSWLTISGDNNESTCLAFKLNADQKIIPCNEDEGVFHCYLPTLEKVGFPFKINSDFSTDPSRKHLTADERTNESIERAAELLFRMVTQMINGETDERFDLLFDILLKRSSFSKFSIQFHDKFKRKISGQDWLRLNNGLHIHVNQYKLLPGWLEDSEKKLLRNDSSYVKEMSLPQEVYECYPLVDDFLQNYTIEKYEIADFIEALKSKSFVKNLNPLTLGKIIGNCIKSARAKTMLTGNKYLMNDCFALVKGKAVKLADIQSNSEMEIDEEIQAAVHQVATISDLEWFCTENGHRTSMWMNPIPTSQTIQSEPLTATSESVTVHKKHSVSKWRSAEQQCVEMEQFIGNKAVDVSKQNLGYDVESRKPDGEIRYIEVKLLSHLGDSFTMTNNEYTSAHQHGKKYFLCLMVLDDQVLKAVYVQDPIAKLKLEKRVRQWEWLCEVYAGEQITIELK